MELDGTIVGKFGKAGKLPGEFSTIHEMDCRNDNEAHGRRNYRLAGAENQTAPLAQSIERKVGSI